MIDKIHIFYNGNDAFIPKSGEWEEFCGHDSLRMFCACAESWRRHGWEVKRISTNDIFGQPSKRFNFSGRLNREEYKWYPRLYWQFIAAACQIPGDQFLFGTYDVFNYGVWPYMWRGVKAPLDVLGCYSFQRDHFSMSLFRCTKDWLLKARQILIDYDSGKLPEIKRSYVSDETILRKYAHYTTIPDQSFPLGPDFNRFNLLHFSRSSLLRYFYSIPCEEI